jgi:hypothetical protein
MGVHADLIANATVIDTTEPQEGSRRSAYNELAQHAAEFDPVRPSGFDAKNEVQTIGQFVATVSGGNFTITIVDENGVSHTTANIAYNANQATIEGAIDTKMTADSYPGWTNSDISVALTGDLTANGATVTFDGTSVAAKNMGQLVVADVDLSGGGGIGTQGTTTHGQSIRYPWAVMWAHGMITAADLPAQGNLMSVGASLDMTPANSTAHWPRAALRKALAAQAAVDDDNAALRPQLEALFKVE